ncbi:PAS domain S-box protein [Endothiovibrio diazotrophicus]
MPKILRKLDTLPPLYTGLLMWVTLVVPMSAGFWFHHEKASREMDEAMDLRLIAALHEGLAVFRHRLHHVERDLLFARDNPVLARLLETGSPADRAALDGLFNSLMRTRREVLYQLRYLDENGREVVRIDNRPDGTRTIPTADLQDKSGRYYFRNLLTLTDDEIYISPLDLNMEHGRIEQPFQPTIRFAGRIRSDDGSFKGGVVINYHGNELIRRLKDIGRQHDINLWLTNQDGAWIIGPDPELEWGFMYPDRKIATLGDRYPSAWNAAKQTTDSDTVEVRENGDILAINRLTPATEASGVRLVNPGLKWYLIVEIPAARVNELKSGIANRYSTSVVFLAALFALFSFSFTTLAHRRRTAMASLARRESQFHALLESSPDATIVTDADGHIMVVNKQVETLFGYTRDEILGKRVETLIPERYRTDHVAHRGGYLNHPRPRQMGQGELFARRADGGEFPVSVALNSVVTNDERQLIAVIRDVTEAHQHAAALESALAEADHSNRQLEASTRELESFSYSVSHDLRAPLRSVDGFGKLLLKHHADKLNEEGRDLLDRMRAAAQRMSVLIDEMLLLSRITRSEVSRQPVDLSAMAGETVARLREASPEREVDVVIEPGLEIEADPRLLGIALENLIGNAWKFTANTPGARIEFGREPRDGTPEFYVRDNGAGFDMDYADKLFIAFQRLHTPAEFPGSGIGLATVMRVISKHGGTVRAEGAVGQGASFWFTVDP